MLERPSTDRSEATTRSGSYLVWSEGRSEACTLAGSRRPPSTAGDRIGSGSVRSGLLVGGTQETPLCRSR